MAKATPSEDVPEGRPSTLSTLLSQLAVADLVDERVAELMKNRGRLTMDRE